jgi:hypothetical protein
MVEAFYPTRRPMENTPRRNATTSCSYFPITPTLPPAETKHLSSNRVASALRDFGRLWRSAFLPETDGLLLPQPALTRPQCRVAFLR